MSFGESDLTCDGFLDGKLSIWQPRKGYRAATDPVFLAAAIPATSGQSVLELGCGVGVASLCLAARVWGLSLTGVEIQPDYGELARRNAAQNNTGFLVIDADIARLPQDVVQASYDHVIANPPYLAPQAGTAAMDKGRERAFRQQTPLAIWVDTAARRLRPGGVLSMIHLAERLPELLACLDTRFGDIEIKPISPRRAKPAGRVIVRARKGARGALRLHAPFVVHQGDVHDGDRDSTSADAQAVLRQGLALQFAAR